MNYKNITHYLQLDYVLKMNPCLSQVKKVKNKMEFMVVNQWIGFIHYFIG